MPTKVYDSINHAAYLTTYDDITFKIQGAPDGDFITVTYDNDAVTGSEGANEDVQFSQRQASMGTITTPTQWGSVTNEQLNQVFKDQQAGRHPKKLQIKRISDDENVLIWNTSRALIMKVPDYNIGTVASDRTWNWKVEKLKPEELTAPA